MLAKLDGYGEKKFTDNKLEKSGTKWPTFAARTNWGYLEDEPWDDLSDNGLDEKEQKWRKKCRLFVVGKKLLSSPLSSQILINKWIYSSRKADKS